MAGIKISDLPDAPSAQLTDVFPVDQLPGPITYKESNSQLLALFQANGAAGSNGNVQYNNNGAFGGDSGFNTDGAGNIKISGTLAVGSSSIPNSTVEIRNTLSGSTTDVLRLTNATSSGVNSGVSLTFQPNNQSIRAASIRSLQTTAGNFADLEFYTAGGGTPSLGMSINTSQQVIINSSLTAVGVSGVGSNTRLQINNANALASQLISSFVNSPSGSALRLLKSRSTTVGGFTAVQSGDDLGRVAFFGDDGTTYLETARILSTVPDAVSTGIVPGNLSFYTTNTSGTLTLGMVLSDSQTLTLANPLSETNGGTNQSSYILGDTLYASSANTLSKLAGNTTSGIKYLSQTGTGVASAAPVWSTISGGDITGAALTKTDDTNVTLTLGGTPTTALLRAASLTLGWSGVLSGTRGGTGVNNGSSTITLGGNLTTSGAFASTFTMTNTTSVTFPTSGTLATTSQIPSGAALTKTDDTNVTLTLGGSPTTALVNAASLTLGWTGQLGLTRGGTAASLTASNGGIVYSTASALAILSGTATAGQMLQSGSSAAPSWSTATFPDTAGSAGTILRSNGTNWVNSTTTFADTYSASTLLYSNGANTVTGLATANSAVLVTSSAGVPAWSGTMTNGQVIIGSTSATPTAATLTAGSGIAITNGAGSITIASTTSGMTWTTVSGTSQSAAVNNGYITNNAGAVTITLPTTFAVGDEVEVKGLGAGGWVLAAGTATTIRLGSSVTSSAGSLTSANQYDTVKVTGLVANTTWSVDYALSTGLTVA